MTSEYFSITWFLLVFHFYGQQKKKKLFRINLKCNSSVIWNSNQRQEPFNYCLLVIIFFFVHQNDTTKTDVCSIHTFKDNKWILEHITNQQPLNTVSTLNRKQLFIYLKWKWKFLLRRFKKPQAFSLHIHFVSVLIVILHMVLNVI